MRLIFCCSQFIFRHNSPLAMCNKEPLFNLTFHNRFILARYFWNKATTTSSRDILPRSFRPCRTQRKLSYLICNFLIHKQVQIVSSQSKGIHHVGVFKGWKSSVHFHFIARRSNGIYGKSRNYGKRWVRLSVNGRSCGNSFDDVSECSMDFALKLHKSMNFKYLPIT